MLDEIVPLPEDPEELRAFTARLLAEVKAQAILIEKLRHQLAGHRAHRFGASSETAEQLQLALETSEIAAAAMTARLRLPDVEEKDKPKRRPIPDHIPRMEVELTPAADACADCGGKLRRIGEDVTEELEYVPGRFIVNRIVRPRLTCSGCERFVQAPLPSRPIERGRPGPGLLAHVLVSKYADHLPLYRQSQIFRQELESEHGIKIGPALGREARPEVAAELKAAKRATVRFETLPGQQLQSTSARLGSGSPRSGFGCICSSPPSATRGGCASALRFASASRTGSREWRRPSYGSGACRRRFCSTTPAPWSSTTTPRRGKSASTVGCTPLQYKITKVDELLPWRWTR